MFNPVMIDGIPNGNLLGKFENQYTPIFYQVIVNSGETNEIDFKNGYKIKVTATQSNQLLSDLSNWTQNAQRISCEILDDDDNTICNNTTATDKSYYSIDGIMNPGFAITLFEEPFYTGQKNFPYALGIIYFNVYERYTEAQRFKYKIDTVWGYLRIPNPTLENTQAAINNLINGNDPNFTDPTTDPYSKGGQNDTGGGTGDFDGESDTIDIPGFPSISVTDTGFVGLFTPTLSQLKSLSDYMWSDLFSVDTFKKIFADPMDCILGLSIVPVAVPTSTTGAVRVGNISTGVTLNIASSQYVSVDCGTLNINEYWGSFLDYAPHTKAQIYLPYVGVRQIDTDEIMGRAVRIVYHVDILTGACICFITSGGSVLYTFEGACASSIPITGSNFTEMINTIVSIAGAAVATAATGGAAAPTVAAAAGQTATKVTAQIGLSTATNISNMKPTIEHSGSVAGAGALLAVQKPYLIAHRPNQCLPGNQNTFSGYPSYITATLGAQSGFTQVEYINLSGLSATEAEAEEIERELKSGVII